MLLKSQQTSAELSYSSMHSDLVEESEGVGKSKLVEESGSDGESIELFLTSMLYIALELLNILLAHNNDVSNSN